MQYHLGTFIEASFTREVTFLVGNIFIIYSIFVKLYLVNTCSLAFKVVCYKDQLLPCILSVILETNCN